MDSRGVALAFGAVAIAFGAMEDAGDRVEIEADGPSKAISTAHFARSGVHIAKGTGFEEGAAAPIASAIAPIALAHDHRRAFALPLMAGRLNRITQTAGCAGWSRCSPMCG